MTRRQLRWFIASATLATLGVPAWVRGGDSANAERIFELTYTATVRSIPESAQSALLWIPVPPSVAYQTLLGFEERRQKHTTKAQAGHFAKAGVSPRRVLYEVRLSPEEAEGLEPGQELECGAVFEGVAKVDVEGVTKGRGFTGVIKRWNFHMPKATHGTHEFHRHAGALGAGTYPGRIVKGKKMAGQYGSERATTLGLRVEKLDAENGLLFVRGSVPGHRRALVRVRPSTR